MHPKDRSEEKQVRYEELFEIGVKALEIVGVSKKDAKTAVRILLWADLRGIETHGIQRLLMYIPRLKDNLINQKPNITVNELAPAIKLISGDNGLGPLIAEKGMREAISLAKETGIAFVGCKDSNHFGAAAPYVLMACEERMIGIAGTNALPTMAPLGGSETRIGNNPLSIGAPAGENPPFVLDMAMSISSRGRIRAMAEKKEILPDGWALDSHGNPTKDPQEALKGFVLPIGMHKGYGLAVAMDILSGVLTGAGFSIGVKSLLQQWEEPQHIGHFFITIDPTRFMSWDAFTKRMKQLYALLKNSKRVSPEQPIIIAGEPETLMENDRRKNGIPIDKVALIKLIALSEGKYEYQVPSF